MKRCTVHASWKGTPHVAQSTSSRHSAIDPGHHLTPPVAAVLVCLVVAPLACAPGQVGRISAVCGHQRRVVEHRCVLKLFQSRSEERRIDGPAFQRRSSEQSGPAERQWNAFGTPPLDTGPRAVGLDVPVVARALRRRITQEVRRRMDTGPIIKIFDALLRAVPASASRHGVLRHAGRLAVHVRGRQRAPSNPPRAASTTPRSASRSSLCARSSPAWSAAPSALPARSQVRVPWRSVPWPGRCGC